MSVLMRRVSDAALLPWRIARMMWRDFRCDWLGRHEWVERRSEWWSIRGPHGRAEEVYEVCANPYCRQVKLGSWRIEQPFEITGEVVE